MWFSHYTFDRGQSNAEVLASFEQFVKRMRHVEGYCLMGAEDHWRWRGENRGPAPCRCEHCRKQGVIRIDH